MGTFCQDQFWNFTLIWESENPNFSDCFRNTILPGIPTGFLLITIPFWYAWIRSYKPKLQVKTCKLVSTSWKNRMTFLFFTKVALNLMLIIQLIFELFWRLNHQEIISGSGIFYSLCLILSTSLALTTLFLEKKCLIRSSPPLSIYWPLVLICYLPNLKQEIELLQDEFEWMRLIGTSTFFTFSLSMVILNLWADKSDLEPIKENIAPNNTNSFFSSVFLTWMDGMIWKGFRKPLIQDDLFHMPEKVDVNENVKCFEKEWKDYLERNNIKFNHKNINAQKKAFFWIPLMRSFGMRFLLGNVLAFFHYSIVFTGPFVSLRIFKVRFSIICMFHM